MDRKGICQAGLGEVSPDRAFARAKHLSESERKADDTYSTEEETRDLCPASIALTEIADKIVPRAIVGAHRTLYQKHYDKEEGANGPVGDQEPGCQGILSRLLVLG